MKPPNVDFSKAMLIFLIMNLLVVSGAIAVLVYYAEILGEQGDKTMIISGKNYELMLSRIHYTNNVFERLLTGIDNTTSTNSHLIQAITCHGCVASSEAFIQYQHQTQMLEQILSILKNQTMMVNR